MEILENTKRIFTKNSVSVSVQTNMKETECSLTYRFSRKNKVPMRYFLENFTCILKYDMIK